jgi:hypothetical protein
MICHLLVNFFVHVAEAITRHEAPRDVAREDVRRHAEDALATVTINPNHHRVAVDRHAVAERSSPSLSVSSSSPDDEAPRA